VESSCEFGIEPSGSINARKQSSVVTTRDLSSNAQLHRVSGNRVFNSTEVRPVCVSQEKMPRGRIGP
jgi:hypothetical protein